MLKKIFFSIFLFFLAVPLWADAHVKWFVNENLIEPKSYLNENAALYKAAWLFIALAIISFGILLEKYLPKAKKDTLYKLNAKKPYVFSLLQIIIGAFFVLASYNGFLFSNNLNNFGIFTNLLLTVQALIGILFVLGAFARPASFVLFFLWAIVFLLNPIGAAEALWVLGVSLFFLIVGRQMFAFSNPKTFFNKIFLTYEKYSIPILRIFLGVDLIILGFTEKLLRPELALAFLKDHPWNFMQNIFGVWWYSDYLFVISAGFVEALLGLVFVLGIVTRINAMVTATIFFIPLFIMGPKELIGHIPHFAIVATLLIFGSGSKFKLIKQHKNSK